MDRYTKKHAEQCANRLAVVLKKKMGKCWKTVDGKNVAEIGCWSYDHNSIYGGGNIEEIINEGGGITHPFGSKRLKPETFCDATSMSERAVEIDRGEK